MVCPLGGAVAGWAALRWCGAHWFDGLTPDGGSQLPVVLLTGDHNIRSQPGYRVSEERRPLHDLMVVDGVVVTRHIRSVGDEMRYATNERAAVVAFDMAAYADLVSLEEMSAHLATLSGWTGIPQARAALTWCDENSWSPWESVMRGIWQHDAGLPPPLCNRPIFDRRGNLVGTPDLLDHESGLIGEYDGEVHLANERRVKDRERERKFRQLGLECVTMMRGDSANREATARAILEARSRARWQADSERLWTIEEPEWWTPTYTVAQRRGLTATQRARFLAHRQPAAAA